MVMDYGLDGSKQHLQESLSNNLGTSLSDYPTKENIMIWRIMEIELLPFGLERAIITLLPTIKRLIKSTSFKT
jgi:hypothetical protein